MKKAFVAAAVVGLLCWQTVTQASEEDAMPPAYTCAVLDAAAHKENTYMRPDILGRIHRQIEGMRDLEAAVGLPPGSFAQRNQAELIAIGGLLTVCQSGGVAPTAPLSVWLAIGWLQSLAQTEGLPVNIAMDSRAVSAWLDGGL